MNQACWTNSRPWNGRAEARPQRVEHHREQLTRSAAARRSAASRRRSRIASIARRRPLDPPLRSPAALRVCGCGVALERSAAAASTPLLAAPRARLALARRGARRRSARAAAGSAAAGGSSWPDSAASSSASFSSLMPIGPIALRVEELPDHRLLARQQHLAGPEHRQVPVVEQADVVRHRAGGVDVVGDDQAGGVGLGVEVDDQLVQVGGAHRVEAGVGLVEQDDLGVEHQRTGQAGALAHAAGDLAGQLVLGAGEADQLHLLGDDRLDLGLGLLACARAAGRRCCRRGSSSRTARRPGTARRTACAPRRGRDSRSRGDVAGRR